MAVDGSESQGERLGDAPWLTEEMTSTLYDELREIAVRQFRSERSDHTLQPTALVNEAYMRLTDQTRTDWKDSSHFRAIASKVMRRILVDHARTKSADKRGGQFQRICLTLVPLANRDDPVEVTMVHDLLDSLADLNPRHASVVEYRVFGGMTLAEIAETLQVSLATVKKDWRFAKAWLLSQVSNERSS